MIRKIIKINQDLCNGCGACVAACHEGAIQMVNGKAVLTREDYCDGLGDCLPACPTDAISFEEREAPAYDEAAVKKAQAKKASPLRQRLSPPPPVRRPSEIPVSFANGRYRSSFCLSKLLTMNRPTS